MRKNDPLKEQTGLNLKPTAQIMLALFTVLSVFIAGCSVQETQQGNDVLPLGESIDGEAPSEDLGTNSADDDDNRVEMDADSKKSEIEKNQDLMAQLVADGTYSDEVSYDYHSGTENVIISLSVENDIVTSAFVEGINPAKMSQRYIEGFNAALPDLVVGKKISELNLPIQVGGSSLTNKAFQDYVAQVIDTY